MIGRTASIHYARRRRESPAALVEAAIIYAVGVACAWLLSEILGGTAWLTLLHIASAFSFYWYWRRSWWGGVPFDCFGAALLLFAMAFRCIAIADATLYGTRLDTWPSTVTGQTILQYVFMGEAITQIGLMLVVLSWRWGVRWSFEGLGVFWVGQQRERAAWIVYILAVVFAFGRWSLKLSFGAAEQLVGIIYLFGIASILFIAMDTRCSAARSAVLALALGLPLSILALGSGMKEYIFLPVMPAAVCAWRASRGFASKFILVFLAVAVLAISQLYVGYVRAIVWVDKFDRSSGELVSGFIDETVESGSDLLLVGVDGIFSRTNLTLTHAITVALTDQYGFIPSEIFGPIPASFVPRALWSGKPVLRPGAEQTVRIRGAGDASEERTSTASGFLTELYLGGGVPGLILGSILYGFLQGRIQGRIRRFRSVLGLGVFNFVLFYSAARFDEQHVAYIFTGMIALFLGFMIVFPVMERSGIGRERRLPLNANRAAIDKPWR